MPDTGVSSRKNGDGFRVNGKNRPQTGERSLVFEFACSAIGMILPIGLGYTHIQFTCTDGVDVVNGSAGTFRGATDSVLLTVFVDQSADCTTGGIINAGDTTGPDGYKSLSTPCGETEQCADCQHGEMFRPSKHYVLSDLNE